MAGEHSRDDSRLTRRQRHVVIALAVVCLVLTSAALVTAQSGQTTLDDFEDNDISDWSLSADSDNSGTNGLFIEDSIVAEGDHALEVNDSGTSGYTAGEFSNFTHTGYSTISSMWRYEGGTYAYMEVTGDNGLLYALTYDAGTGWEVESEYAGTNKESIDLPVLDGYDEIILSFDYDNEQSTVYMVRDDDIVAEDTFDWRGGSGSTSITELEYGTQSSNFYVDSIVGNESLPGDVSVDANNYMRPGTSQRYAIEFNPSGSNTTEDVTENATLTSSDNDTLTVYPGNNTLVATENSSDLPATVTLTATYEEFSGTKNVTIAKPSVENLDSLPTWWKVNATVGDGMMLWLIVATLCAVVATRAATSFAGVGAYVMIMIAGWMAGPVSDGVMIAAILTGLFLGMNLAANVDTTIRGSG